MIKKLLEPKSIAIIGASRKEQSVGYSIVNNLSDKKIFLVNPNTDEILGYKTYPSVLYIKEKVDLGIIVVPAKFVLSVLEECGKKGIKSVIIISSGFTEAGNPELQEEVLKIKRKYKMRILGPNCLGVITPDMNASFAPSKCVNGNIAFVSQSGALIDSILDWSLKEKYGFSALVSVGNAADIGFSELIEYFDYDPATKVIALYLEGLKDGERFIKALKKTKKPVIILKSGRTEKSGKAAFSHTGSMTSSYDVYKAVFKQFGAIEVNTLEELFSMSKLFSLYTKTDNSTAIISNAGGACVLAYDYLEEYGVKLADISKLKELDLVMPKFYTRANPLDVIGDATSIRYNYALKVLLSKSKIKACLVIITPQKMTDFFNIANGVVELSNTYGKPVLVCLMGGNKIKRAKEYLDEKDIPTFTDLRLACYSLSKLVS